MNTETQQALGDLLGVRVEGASTAEAVRAEMAALADQLDTMDRAARAGAVAALMEGDALQRCAVLARVDPGGWSAACVRLSAVHGMGGHIQRLQTLVKGAIRGLSVATDAPGDQQSGPAPEGIGWAPSGWRCPPAWSVNPRGVWGPDPSGDGEIQVSRVPLLPVGRLLDIDTGDHHIRLSWPGWTGATYARVVRQSVTVDARTLTATLGDRGAGVTSGNAGLMVRFLNLATSHNARALPVERVASRCGWVHSGTARGFLRGRAWHGSPETVALQVEPGGGEEQILAAVSTGGTWRGWLETVAGAADCPDVHLSIYASVASVLVSRLGTARGWVVDWSGETSQGKTTALRVGASVWGAPVDGAMLQSWRATPVQIEAAAALFRNLPIILDDTKNARRGEDVAAIVYQHSQGRGKGRGKPGVGSQAVGMRRTAEWSSVMLSTGEQSAVSFTQDAGSRARCLCLVGPPLRSDTQARALTVGLLDHYGHLGVRVADYLAGQSDDWWAVLAVRYANRVAAWSARLSDAGAVAQRLGGLLALLTVAQEVAEAAGYPVPPPGVDPIDRAAKAVRVGSEDADRPLAALRAVYEHCAARGTQCWGRHVEDRDGCPREPSGGWLGAWPKPEARRGAGWALAVIPSVIDRVLTEGGFDRGVVERWRERGWIARQSSSYRVRVRVDTARVRCVGFTVAAFSALGLTGPEADW